MDVSALSAAPATETHAYGESGGTNDRSTPATATGSSTTLRVKTQAPAPLPVKPEKAPVDDSPRIKVEIKQRASGSAHTTVVDTRTGLPLLELPPEHVVQVVEGILWRQRHAKDESPSSQPRSMSNDD